MRVPTHLISLTTKMILRVQPVTHFHLKQWKRRAHNIPDPELRRQALASLLQLASESSDAFVLSRVGRGLVNLGSARQAADVFHEVLKASPRAVAAYSGLGEAELAEENYREAKQAFEQAMRLDPSDEAARARAALCERVLELDPTLRGLRAADRYERSRRLLAAAVSAVGSCQGPPSHADFSPLLRQARQVLASSRRPPSLSDATDRNTDLAARLWAARPQGCPETAAIDQALVRVLARVDR